MANMLEGWISVIYRKHIGEHKNVPMFIFSNASVILNNTEVEFLNVFSFTMNYG